MRMASSLASMPGALALLLLSACTGDRVGSPEPTAWNPTGGYRSLSDSYPRRSWHPKEPPACCGGLDIRLEPAPPCAPPAYVAPCAPPPCAPPYAPPPCAPAYEPPPCPPPCYEPAPCAPPPCEPVCATPCWRITPHARYWRPAPSGDMTITAGGAPGSGTKIDLKGDLDLQTANEGNYGLDIAYGRHRLRFSYEPLTWHGSSTLDRSVVFHGVTYNTGERVDSDVELTFLRVGYDFALVDEPNGKLRIGLEGYGWRFNAKFDGSVNGATSRGFTHLMPAITLDADARFGSWHLRGSAAYGTLFESGRYLVDLEAAIGVRLWSRVTIDVGWRYWNLVFHETTNLGDLKASGPFAEVSIDL